MRLLAFTFTLFLTIYGVLAVVRPPIGALGTWRAHAQEQAFDARQGLTGLGRARGGEGWQQFDNTPRGAGGIQRREILERGLREWLSGTKVGQAVEDFLARRDIDIEDYLGRRDAEAEIYLADIAAY